MGVRVVSDPRISSPIILLHGPRESGSIDAYLYQTNTSHFRITLNDINTEADPTR
jgi:hypothetical protein